MSDPVAQTPAEPFTADASELPPTDLDFTPGEEFSDLPAESAAEESTETAEEPADGEQVEASSESVEAAETPAEAATEPPAPETKPEPAVSRMAAELDVRMRQLGKAEAQLAAQQQALAPFMEAYNAAQSGDRIGALEKMGVTYEDLTNEFAQSVTAPIDKRLHSEVAALRQQLAEQQQYVQQQATAKAHEDSIKHASEVVTGNTEKFPHVAATNAINLVHDTVQEHLARTGTVVSYEDAAQAVEEGLAELFKVALENESLRSKYSPLFTSSESSGNDKAAESSATLTEPLSQTVTTSVDDSVDWESLSEEESIDRLAPLLQFS